VAQLADFLRDAMLNQRSQQASFAVKVAVNEAFGAARRGGNLAGGGGLVTLATEQL